MEPAPENKKDTSPGDEKGKKTRSEKTAPGSSGFYKPP